MLTPVSAPRISSDPVVNTVFSAPAVQLNGVIGGVSVAGVIHVDATGVGFNAIGIDVGRDWTTSKNFSHNIFIASDTSVFTKGDLWIVGDGI